MSEERAEEPAASAVVEEEAAAHEAPSASAPPEESGHARSADAPATATAAPPSPPAVIGRAAGGDGRSGNGAAEPDVSFDEFAASMAQGGSFRALKEGDVVRGVVVHIDREGVLVDVGTKPEGLIPPNE